MRAANTDKGTPLNMEYIPLELHRLTEEEFEIRDQESCLASAD